VDAKSALRARMRLVLTDIDDRLMRSVALWARLAELADYRQANTVMAFAATTGEPDTEPLHARLAADGKRLALPRIEHDRIVPATALGAELRVGTFGMREPDGPAVPVAELDLVVVPGMAFTAGGLRLGHGGGHYDRFLATVAAHTPPPPTIGVCFAEQLCDELPAEPHDVRVDRVLTA
jgi:5-formyltetrahydrofolate cyclo-ligase